MPGREFLFYADDSDIPQLLDKVKQGGYQFFPSLMLADPIADSALKAGELSAFTRRTEGGVSPVFLAMPHGLLAVYRKINLSSGAGIKYFADQNGNIDAVKFRMGGQTESGSLIAFSVNTTAESKLARENFDAFKRMIASAAAICHKGTYLMNGALIKANSGWRLTIEPKYSREMDFKF
jgi:hypothetical protein